MLLTVTQVLLQDHEKRQVDFHQLPYHRFFIMILNDLCSPDPVFDAISFPVLQCFWLVYSIDALKDCNNVFSFSTAYHMVRPSKAPGFAYSWLELISHRVFVSKLLLQTPQQKVTVAMVACCCYGNLLLPWCWYFTVITDCYLSLVTMVTVG